MKLKLALIVALSLVLLIITMTVPAPASKPVEIACTMDAKICPDGSAVGRSGPKCEFAECPAQEQTNPKPSTWPTNTSATGIGEEFTMHGISITPLEVVEDSRCPSDVVCIHAGNLRLKAVLTTGTTTQESILVLNGEAVLFAEKYIRLIGALPYPMASADQNPKDYSFEFLVQTLAQYQFE